MKTCATFLAMGLLATGCATRQAVMPSPVASPAAGAAVAPAPVSSGANDKPLSAPALACDSAGLRGGEDVVRLYDKACDGGDVEGCHMAALHYTCGVGVSRDLRKASDRAERACEHGATGACGNAGVMLGLPDATSAELDRALRALHRGCDAGDKASCNNLAGAMMNGIGMNPDVLGALKLFQRMCESGNLPSCANEAVLYVSDNAGIPRDLPRAVSIVTPACEKDEPTACYVLGKIYASFDEYSTRRGEIASLFQRACDGGQAAACGDLGTMFAEGIGLASDAERAQGLLTRACDGGNPQACTHLAQLRSQVDAQQGPIITRSTARSGQTL
jgi:TPR repeat protein